MLNVDPVARVLVPSLHTMPPDRSPLSWSEAVAANVTDVPTVTVGLLGSLIVTLGLPSTVTVTDVCVVLPALSVADAVIVWLPGARVLMLNPAPVASVVEPSVQTRWAVRSPSSKSDAVPANVIVSPWL